MCPTSSRPILGLTRSAPTRASKTLCDASAFRNNRQFLRDADPDIPILKEAKAEYAKLQ